MICIVRKGACQCNEIIHTDYINNDTPLHDFSMSFLCKSLLETNISGLWRISTDLLFFFCFHNRINVMKVCTSVQEYLLMQYVHILEVYHLSPLDEVKIPNNGEESQRKQAHSWIYRQAFQKKFVPNKNGYVGMAVKQSLHYCPKARMFGMFDSDRQ